MKLKLDTEDFIKERTISQKKDYWTGSNKKAKQEALLTTKKVQLTIEAPGRQHKTSTDASIARARKSETAPSQSSSLGVENGNKTECAIRMEKT